MSVEQRAQLQTITIQSERATARLVAYGAGGWFLILVLLQSLTN